MTLAVVLVPLAAALLLPLLRGALLQRFVAVAASIATFVVALFVPGANAIETPWLEGLGVWFALDPSGAAGPLILAAALVTIPTVLWASARVDDRRGGFLALLFATQAGLAGIFLAADLVLFYVFWEATLIPSLILLGVWGGERRREAVLKYAIYAVAGSFLMLIAILALRPLAGAADYRIESLMAATTSLGLRTQVLAFVGFALAFAVKLPLWPLHSWLIDFHEQNHPSGAADVAGTLYKVGGFGFFAWAIPLLPDGAAAVAPYLLVLAAGTAVYAGMAATQQTHLKRLLAYASLSHMGIVGVGVFGLTVAGMNGAMYLLAAQMLSTGGLFLLGGMLHARSGSYELDDHGGLAARTPALAAVFLFVLFASIGVPGLGNFPGEFLALAGGFQASVGLGIVATLSVIAAGVVGVNLYQRLYQGRGHGPAAARAPDLGAFEWIVVIPVIAGILWLGLAPAPQLERIEAQTVVADASLTSATPPARPSLANLAGGPR